MAQPPSVLKAVFADKEAKVIRMMFDSRPAGRLVLYSHILPGQLFPGKEGQQLPRCNGLGAVDQAGRMSETAHQFRGGVPRLKLAQFLIPVTLILFLSL